jgi:putative flippase GtrA
LGINQLFNSFLKYDLSRFIVVGITTVLIDLGFYLILNYFIFDTTLSKGVSFTIGALFSYFANKNFTFNSSKRGLLRFLFFSALYVSTLIANVVSNSIVLNSLSQINYSLIIAFLIATTISATLNFLGMKYFIFSSK